MKIFEHANLHGEDTCLVCKKAEDKPVILVGVIGTEKDGNMQAKQVHVDCLELFFYPEHKLIAQKCVENCE